MSYFQDGSQGVISCTKVLPPGDCTQSMHSACCMHEAASASYPIALLSTVPNPQYLCTCSNANFQIFINYLLTHQTWPLHNT